MHVRRKETRTARAYNLAEQSQREANGCGRHAVPHVGDLQRSPRPVAHHTGRELIKHTDIQLNRSLTMRLRLLWPYKG